MDEQELAVEVARLRGEMTTGFERLGGQVMGLEEQVKGSIDAHRNAVDGKIALLTSVTSDLRTGMGAQDKSSDRMRADLDEVARLLREHIAHGRGSRDRTVSTREWVAWLLASAAALFTVLSLFGVVGG